MKAGANFPGFPCCAALWFAAVLLRGLHKTPCLTDGCFLQYSIPPKSGKFKAYFAGSSTRNCVPAGPVVKETLPLRYLVVSSLIL